jgi:hypothetical protein
MKITTLEDKKYLSLRTEISEIEKEHYRQKYLKLFCAQIVMTNHLLLS